MSEINAILSSAKWAEDSYYLKEFVHKFKLPQVAKVIKGQYQNLGVSTLSNPSLTCNVLLVAAPQPRPALIAQSVKFKDGKRVVPVGPKLSIPRSYDGYFEILSEDGRCVRCIESVAELSRRFPETVLVRDNVKAFVSKSDDVESIQDKSRTITSGEVLILVGEVLGVKGKTQSRYLRCLDSGGENIYLPLETKGKFSAIAKEENISGVHNVQNLLKKRLPLMARLVHGNPPQGQKISQTFTSDLRVLCGTEDTGILAVPLTKELMSVYLPLTGNLKLQPVSNSDFISGMAEVKRIETRAVTQFEDWSDSILVYDVSIPKEPTLHDRKQLNLKNTSLTQETKRSSLYGIISSRTDHNGRDSHTSSHHGGSGGKQPPDDYDEIDQIYDYVRGFAPLPKSAKGWQYIPEHGPHTNDHSEGGAATRGKEAKGEDKKETGYGRTTRASKDYEKHHVAPLSIRSPTSASAATTDAGAENEPPEPPPLETLPSRKYNPSHIDCNTPPINPNYSPPWGSPVHQPAAENGSNMLPLHPSNNNNNNTKHNINGCYMHGVITPSPSPYNGTLERTQSAGVAHTTAAAERLYEKSSESKKRQRPKTADSASRGGGLFGSKDKDKTTSYGHTTPSQTNRYIKASHKQNGGGSSSTIKHKFFKSKKDKDKDGPPPLGSKESGGGGLGIQPPSFFHLRYKSLTNLTAQEYDTLDSSNSGGKTSFDSAGSRNIPEKRSRKLVRPKSLTNLAWDFRTSGPSVSQPATPVHHKSSANYHSSSGDTLKRSSSKPSLLVADKGRQDGLGTRDGLGTTRLRRGVIPRGSDASPLTRRSRNLSSTLYL